MKKPVFTLLFFLLYISTALAEALPEYSLTYDPKRNALQDGRDAIKLASATNRRIFIKLGGDWCKWCHILDRFLNTHPDIKSQLYDSFVVLKVNVSDENDNSEFLKVFPPSNGYPHMYITESNGKLLLSNDMTQFLVNGKYSKKKFNAFFKRWRLNKAVIAKEKYD